MSLWYTPRSLEFLSVDPMVCSPIFVLLVQATAKDDGRAGYTAPHRTMSIITWSWRWDADWLDLMGCLGGQCHEPGWLNNNGWAHQSTKKTMENGESRQ